VRVVGAAETLEGVAEKSRRETGALVENVYLDGAVVRGGPEQDNTRAVTERVVDHVPDRLLETQAIGVDERRLAGLDLQLAVLRSKAAGDRLHDLVDVQRLELERQLTLLGAREHEQVVGDAREPVGLGRRGLDRLFELVG
jgi:hypothetical protein